MKNDFEIRGDVTAIFIRHKDGSTIETIISTSDLPKAQEFKWRWYPVRRENGIYVKGHLDFTKGERHITSLHRWLIKAPQQKLVDHINHNTLDNRRCNLRLATKSENGQNRKGADCDSKSGLRGVHWCSTSHKWSVAIVVNGKSMSLGYYDDPKVAAEVAANARAKYMPFSKEARMEVAN